MDVEKFVENAIKEIRERVKDGKAIIALSGGVDSSVCTVLAHKALGDRLIPVFVDTGLMREGEPEKIKEIFGNMGLVFIDAKEEFFKALKGVTDPEEKRKVIGELFVRIFERVAEEHNAEYLIQGTIYPDIIESQGGIKSHHNVGGFPTSYKFKDVIEPLRELYKDEVREVARYLGLPKEISERMPFPGPGLAVRIVGEVTPEKVEIVRKANKIVEEELADYDKWQCFAALIGKATGVKGDVRVWGYIIAVRAVESRDGMTADPIKIDYDRLRRIALRITGEIDKVSRVVYDITPKPPATIEYE
ncbi:MULTISPECIES: glutamine-hydrolyzing GMP synthase [Archaeoglobus]|jgi:GMP synthase (glutamine-hydrolysing)|uniref:GMP synthase [glutamine-hydrolyzing] subunit B n=3 Tax=Archaeoglobus fulgidus TaxID=2234 RepID=GUAAB_ARCFU|nr:MULTISPECIES: glutamine-hydrolyzing GMP synthase [Archaeoglobus]O29986.1 RecName: Full=GMP synthase [glutamine-hydrolyzing] subunit B; AltName: Full=GMP synthetase [Archaeoglobus fulgidus DSM 4304]AAB90977.1 GMP synthase (guaA-1) [Archaeoglobus fulgidus DSM 4304]AIG97070.1 GMP synthase (glutamine-hydrolyzing), C-terminal domain protein or B subunit [Archaeoglobus fulgidus DSM 8774]KUJ94509.1 MAG: GMP synthase subunit B [Archaeoglobus fulgidus]KUK07639.1 MAG: GMP synthase [glutamine-hydrolyz